MFAKRISNQIKDKHLKLFRSVFLSCLCHADNERRITYRDCSAYPVRLGPQAKLVHVFSFIHYASLNTALRQR